MAEPLKIVIDDETETVRIDPETGTIEEDTEDGGVVVRLDAARSQDPTEAVAGSRTSPRRSTG